MDVARIQDLFRATDDADADKLRDFLHPELQLTMIGVEGVDEPFDLPGYLRFLAESVAYRDDRGERTEHVPTKIKIDAECIAVRGHLRITSASEPDEYHPYFDILKLRDGKIVEYNIAYDI
jgi:ketosteroid isomerase-like protein